MSTWIYKQTITTPTGFHIDEVKCPKCGYCEMLPRYRRKLRCYVCDTELESDDVFGKIERT